MEKRLRELAEGPAPHVERSWRPVTPTDTPLACTGRTARRPWRVPRGPPRRPAPRRRTSGGRPALRRRLPPCTDGGVVHRHHPRQHHGADPPRRHRRPRPGRLRRRRPPARRSAGTPHRLARQALYLAPEAGLLRQTVSEAGDWWSLGRGRRPARPRPGTPIEFRRDEDVLAEIATHDPRRRRHHAPADPPALRGPAHPGARAALAGGTGAGLAWTGTTPTVAPRTDGRIFPTTPRAPRSALRVHGPESPGTRAPRRPPGPEPRVGGPHAGR
ncbi:hypothetical protein LT493_23110 [Streptomyces tricolor]|nr:hypothetical protein [Streptomyces tricolor]